VGYAGYFGLANALDTVVEAAEMMSSSPVAFVLVGNGPEAPTLRQRAKYLTNVHFLPPLPKACDPELLMHMDALYLGWRRKALYRFGVSPNKLVDYMMAGKPIIHGIETTHDTVSENHSGISIPPEDPAAIADAVERLMKLSPSERTMLANRSRAFARTYHDYSFLAQRFLDVMVGRSELASEIQNGEISKVCQNG
jgi:glycosyltransferase involved in cell wall biosynthesis